MQILLITHEIFRTKERQRFAAETDTGDETRGGSGELEVENERQRPEFLGWAMFFELLCFSFEARFYDTHDIILVSCIMIPYKM